MFAVATVGCGDTINSPVEDVYKVDSNNHSLLDSLKGICSKNVTDTFDIDVLKTDDFEQMILIDKKLFHKIFPNRVDYSDNTFYIYSYLPHDKEHMTLIIYQKNFEGENYRVDYIELVNIDSTGRQLDKIRLTAKDNEVITYEVASFLNNDTLKVIEQISSEPYFDPNMDTLFTTQITYRINSLKRIDTLEIINDFEIRRY